MKKIKNLLSTLALLIAFSCFPFFILATQSYAESDIVSIAQNDGYQTSDFYRPKASIVIDADTGAVLWEDQPDLSWNPASIAKLLSVYLVFDAISEGKFSLETPVVATESDQAISQIYELSNNSIVAGVSYPVSDLIYATLVESSNVATVMLANLVTSNDAAAFIKRMNEKAQVIGMTNSTFYNPSGAASSAFKGYYTPKGIDLTADNVTTARDLATLSYFLLKNHPDILTYTAPTQVTIMKNTPYAELLENHNYSLPGLAYGYEGVDGLKTGSSPTGGFNYAATVKRGNMRLIEVILGVGSWDDQAGELQRHAFGNALFDLAFENYDYKKLLSQGKQTINTKEIILEQDFYGLLAKNTEPTYVLSNNTLTLQNGLSQVATTIDVPSVSYHIENPREGTTHQKELSTSHKNINFTFIVTAFTILLGLLFMLLDKFIQRKQRNSRRMKKKSVYFTFGLLLFLIGIGSICYQILVHFHFL